MLSTGKDVVIYYNDLTDSDGWAAAMALEQAASKNPAVEVVWIIEPRQVAFGLPIAPQQVDQFIKLLEVQFPSQGVRKFLRGLDQDDMGKLEPQHSLDLLELAAMPPHGPKEDALLHCQLTGLDFATFLAELNRTPGKSSRVFLDIDSLDLILNPVNLNIHHHEELVYRTDIELKEYREIMAEQYPCRIKKLRSWYGSCKARQEERAREGKAGISDLDVDSLCATIKAAKSVKFFGGSSLGILQRLIQRGVATNMQCYLQTHKGTFDLSKNIFRNQFNIALNLDAARFVFSNYEKFNRFVIVPSDSTLRVKYCLAGLSNDNQLLAKRFLAFNCRVDAMVLARNSHSTDLLEMEAVIPDLTAFLSAFSDGFAGATLGYARIVDREGQLILEQCDRGILVCEIHENMVFGKDTIRHLMSALELNGTSI